MLRPRFDLTRPCKCNKPAELADAMSELVAQMSADLQKQVYDAIKADQSAARR